MTYRQVAAVIGISPEAVWMMEQRAIRKLWRSKRFRRQHESR